MVVCDGRLEVFVVVGCGLEAQEARDFEEAKLVDLVICQKLCIRLRIPRPRSTLESHDVGSPPVRLQGAPR